MIVFVLCLKHSSTNPGLQKVFYCFIDLKPFPNDKFYTSKLKEFADDIFKFDEIGKKFSKWVENTVEKGEIAHYKQFLLFPQCFQKNFTADT